MSPCHSKQSASVVLLGLLFMISGCLPFSCQPREPRALFPADSLSRQFAELSAVDTLATVWESRGGVETPLVYPRTVRFGAEGKIFVSDVETNAIFEFNPDGLVGQIYTSISYDSPYIIGVKQDTILVLNPTARRVDFTTVEGSNFHIKLPEDDAGLRGLQYATTSEENMYYKVIAEDFQGYIAKLSPDGEVIQRTLLPDPHWRYAGMIRMWGSSLISLSAYRPVVDILSPNGSLDSLALIGFDSPMLARSRAFALGQIRQPPLLYSSAAPSGDSLFVLNLRPGWLRVDVFNREGTLAKRLVQEEPDFNKNFYPIDIDVRTTSEGVIELAIAYLKPEPKLTLYTWTP